MPLDPKKVYAPREWTPPEVERIKRQVAVHRLLDEGKLSSPAGWRENTLRITHDCPHTSGTMFEVENDHGVWAVVICNDCGHPQSKPQCAHATNTWHEDGKVLICDNCGIDGT